MEKLTSSNQITFAAKALSVGYGSSAKTQPVLKNVNLDIEPGKLTILIGSNGCGKSTLLKCMARVLKPMSGQVLLNGEDINKQNPKSVAKQLALLPQGPIAPEGLTVKQLVAQGRYPHQSFFQQWSTEDEEAVLEAMQMANVEELQNRPISEMSGGQRQRCWIAMVLAQQTDIILLDEPTTYLDLKVQVDLLSLLSQLAHDHGRTLVVVLHELNLAASYADHLVMVKNGEIYAQGTPEAVFTASNLRQVFGLQAKVLTDPETGSQICIPTAVPQRNM
ncbi:ABC transporter ATP-binding protein [Vibrio comitans]|uniref:Putative siderophore transport system ATP-binding protein YusV n=1 Tax=Vibrio comitans NBRC 102076 TaxID=1219078 RepID=A0A4Y3IQ47_9VIBR|nr:ABC transporter ATP-binding protein [Vibrio comitans]GEA61486.1 putative siderophore transport system ATP-binding protein YusV [Vibrio comitans NBRC 102076]